MGEDEAMVTPPGPATEDSLTEDLRRIGLRPGDTVLVHCSLRAVGWTSGGAEAVIRALCNVLAGSGTLVMPSQSSQLTDPVGWTAPPIPIAWHETVRETMPAYDVRITPTRRMGVVAEQFRTWPGVRRSAHPALSFAALGPRAEHITDGQPLEDPFGDASPLAVLHRVDARILLLGVGFERCTALHLAERRAWPDRALVAEGAPLLVDGQRRWVRYRVPPLDAAPFPDMGHHLAALGMVTEGTVGAAVCRLLPLRNAIDAATRRWRSMAVEASGCGENRGSA